MIHRCGVADAARALIDSTPASKPSGCAAAAHVQPPTSASTATVALTTAVRGQPVVPSTPSPGRSADATVAVGGSLVGSGMRTTLGRAPDRHRWSPRRRVLSRPRRTAGTRVVARPPSSPPRSPPAAPSTPGRRRGEAADQGRTGHRHEEQQRTGGADVADDGTPGTDAHDRMPGLDPRGEPAVADPPPEQRQATDRHLHPDDEAAVEQHSGGGRGGLRAERPEHARPSPPRPRPSPPGSARPGRAPARRRTPTRRRRVRPGRRPPAGTPRAAAPAGPRSRAWRRASGPSRPARAAPTARGTGQARSP